jgi:hypothetical protein
MKSSFFVRFLIVAGIYLLYILALVQWNLFDSMLTGFWLGAYLIAAVLGVLCASITKGVFPNKKAIDATKSFKKDQKAVIGYWTWMAIWIGAFIIWLPFYAAEI